MTTADTPINLDKIYLLADEESGVVYGDAMWCQDSMSDKDTPYLLATPLREAAADLLEIVQQALADYEARWSVLYTSVGGTLQERVDVGARITAANAAIAKAKGGAA